MAPSTRDDASAQAIVTAFDKCIAVRLAIIKSVRDNQLHPRGRLAGSLCASLHGILSQADYDSLTDKEPCKVLRLEDDLLSALMDSRPCHFSLDDHYIPRHVFQAARDLDIQYWNLFNDRSHRCLDHEGLWKAYCDSPMPEYVLWVPHSFRISFRKSSLTNRGPIL